MMHCICDLEYFHSVTAGTFWMGLNIFAVFCLKLFSKMKLLRPPVCKERTATLVWDRNHPFLKNPRQNLDTNCQYVLQMHI